MAVLALLTLALLAGSACSAPQAPRIVGGTPATIEEFPSLVQVEFQGLFTGIWSQSCAANILTTRYVLSAAHCFEGGWYAPQIRRIRAGSTHRNTGGIVSYMVVENNHPSFGVSGKEGDITVVLLREPLVYSPVVQQGLIIAQDYDIPDNLPVVQAGWGAISHGGPAPNELLQTTIYIINNEVCAARYMTLPDLDYVTENMICAGILDVGGKGACQGDSGGPLYYEGIIIGIISWSHGCANGTFPVVNTRVASYTDWIISVAV